MARETVTGLLAGRIKRARSARGWTAQQLADACARAGAPTLTRGTIAKIESRARKSVAAEEIAVLAYVLQRTPTELLTSPAWSFEPGRSRARLHLVVEVRPDAVDPGLVLVTPWQQDEADSWPPAPGEARLVPVGELEQHVADFASAAEAAWAEHAGSLALELVLPHELMHLPVHRWAGERESGTARPLMLDYEISLRSRERMLRRQWHRRWRLQWDSLLADPSPERIYYAGPDDLAAPARLEAVLADERWVAVVLPGAPMGQVPDPLLPTVRSGMPAVLWHPHAPRDSVRELVGSLVENDGLADLPLRMRSARLAGYEADAGITGDLVLLWDDPSRVIPGERPEPGQAPAG